MWIIFVVAILLAVIVGLTVGAQTDKENKEKADAMNQALTTVPDFSPTMKIVGLHSSYLFATDNVHQAMVYMRGATPQIFKYEDIISVELIEDNTIISSKSTGRTIGGAVLGGVVAGGVGAIVGGLSGTSKQHNLHSSVKVKILLRNSPVPSIEIPCFDVSTMSVDGKPVKDDDIFYRQGKSQATRITDTLTVIIDAVDRANQASQVATSAPASIAEEIAKLAVLKEKGILTDEEFAQQKAKLLDGGKTPKPNEPLKLDLPASDPFDDELREIISTQGPLQAIQHYKEMKGVDLITAKAYIDSLT